VKVVVDDEIEAIFQKNPNQWTEQIEIKKRDGKTLVKRIDFPKGDPETPMSFEETVEKFNKLTENILSEQQRKHIVNKVSKLETLKNVSELFPG